MADTFGISPESIRAVALNHVADHAVELIALRRSDPQAVMAYIDAMSDDARRATLAVMAATVAHLTDRIGS